VTALRRRRRGALAVLATLLTLGSMIAAGRAASDASDEGWPWTDAERRVLRSLWIGSLGPLPDDPSNAYDTDPRAARLGRRLFFDTRFSKNGALACASCHQPALGFQDGRPVAVGLGRLHRRSMPLAGVAYNTWFFWDGRKDSLWAQATTPIENPLELGLTRAEVATLAARHYRADYEAVFGALPADGDATTRAQQTRVFANVGKALAAFVRTIQPTPARFDRWVAALLAGEPAPAADQLTRAEARGLRLFIGKAACINCHAGPLFTNGEFHFTRVPQPAPDQGRGAVIAAVLADELNCRGPFSDAAPEQCSALRFLDPDPRDALHAFKTPSLRNVAARAPYMNAGQLATLAEVVRFYRDRSRGMKELGHGDLSDAELGDLEAFLGTLTGGIAALEAP
jgi:cytochrome c peroxidase